ncbi:hypothetical protein N658DRAFT_451877 [Parathielavia hyrcaniae]|uniref:Uncharacterized protein n=1 Tax=Parathielavia hyrcaniae TaxID=113614 RepID=A0AAN6T0W2_9PEZI|nr:hypothetical protein N658DRAFT_451877 [Parathielavia hyrcaniae]
MTFLSSIAESAARSKLRANPAQAITSMSRLQRKPVVAWPRQTVPGIACFSDGSGSSNEERTVVNRSASKSGIIGQAPASATSTPAQREKEGKTQIQRDEELRQKMEGISGDGGGSGVEYENGKPVAMKRAVRENMFRYI